MLKERHLKQMFRLECSRSVRPISFRCCTYIGTIAIYLTHHEGTTSLPNFAASISKRQRQIMHSLMYLVFCFLTLTPLSRLTPIASVLPTCHEPTSGPYPRPLSGFDCLSIANAIDRRFADITLDLTHGPAMFFDWVQCPLTIQRGGCFFRMDYSRPPTLQNVPLECPRALIVSAILHINSQCVLKNNVDGGEVVTKFTDGSSITFSLTHPPATFGSANMTSTEVVRGDSSFLVGPAKQRITGTS